MKNQIQEYHEKKDNQQEVKNILIYIQMKILEGQYMD